MAGVAGRSGGHNRLSAEEHLVRGTFRPSRHLAALPAAPEPVSQVDRRRTPRRLDPAARRIAAQLLDEFAGWNPSTLELLRSYALSCRRVESLQSAPEPSPQLHREIRCNLAPQKALGLEGK
jgi:hypothetical protein